MAPATGDAREAAREAAQGEAPRRPPAPTRSPDLASRQRQRQEQRMRAVHDPAGWRSRRAVDRTARQRPEAIRRRQWGAVELDAVLQIQDAVATAVAGGADARAAKTAARLLEIGVPRRARESGGRARVRLAAEDGVRAGRRAMWQLRQARHGAAALVQDVMQRNWRTMRCGESYAGAVPLRRSSRPTSGVGRVVRRSAWRAALRHVSRHCRGGKQRWRNFVRPFRRRCCCSVRPVAARGAE